MKTRYLGVVTQLLRDSSVDSAVLLLVLLSGLFFPCVVIDKGARWTIHKTKDGSIVIIRATC